MNYEIAGGSVAGRAHARAGRNNQDSWAWAAAGEAVAAVVCDGCSAGARSEAGAHLGSRLVSSVLARRAAEGRVAWGDAESEILERLKRVADATEADVEQTFLFTIVGVLWTPERAWLFAAGDGAASWNGEEIRLGPFPENRPPYFGYGLAGERVPLTLLREGRAEHAVIATDGAELGLGEFVDDRYFRNPDNVRRRLATSHLEDDATVVVSRRRP